MSLKLPIQVLWRRHRLERSCRWGRAQLERHQQTSVTTLRQFAYERSPFYQHFHKGLERQPLCELPILTKGQLMENFDEVVTNRSLRLAQIEEFLESATPQELFQNQYVVLCTSGTTGRRGVFLFHPREWVHALALITRPLVWSGLNPNPFHPRRAAMIASTTNWHYSSRVSQSLSSRLLPSLRIDVTRPLPEIVQSLNDWQPEILGAYPSILRPLAEEQLAGRLSIPVRHIGTSAEVLTSETRLRVQQAWNARIADTYGGTEYAPIAAECSYGNKHLMEDSAVIEIVDHKGLPVPAGEFGERVLLTVFHRFTQPLIRYEISDMVRPASSDCPCGRPFRMIDAIEGRLEDILVFPARDRPRVSVSVHPNVFHELLERLPVAGWQVVQEPSRVRVLLLGTPPSAISSDTLAVSIRKRLEDDGALSPRIEIEHVDTLLRGPTGKAPLIQRDASQQATQA